MTSATTTSASGARRRYAEARGTGDASDRFILDFCERYADQNEKDYERFTGAVKSGRLEAVEGV